MSVPRPPVVRGKSALMQGYVLGEEMMVFCRFCQRLHKHPAGPVLVAIRYQRPVAARCVCALSPFFGRRYSVERVGSGEVDGDLRQGRKEIKCEWYDRWGNFLCRNCPAAELGPGTELVKERIIDELRKEITK